MADGFMDSFKDILMILKPIYIAVKPIVQMIDIITKLIQPLISMVGDTLFAMIYPIIVILRPLAGSLMKIIMPYKRAAMQLMHQGNLKYQAGDLTGALELWGSAMLVGLSTFIEVFMFQFQTMGEIFFALLTPVIVAGAEMLGADPEKVLVSLNNAKNAYTTFWEKTRSTFRTTVIGWAENIAAGEKGSITGNIITANQTLRTNMTEGENSPISQFGSVDASIVVFKNSTVSFSGRAVTAGNGIISDANSEARQIIARAYAKASSIDGGL